jgi:hypothetical protein
MYGYVSTRKGYWQGCVNKAKRNVQLRYEIRLSYVCQVVTQSAHSKLAVLFKNSPEVCAAARRNAIQSMGELNEHNDARQLLKII